MFLSVTACSRCPSLWRPEFPTWLVRVIVWLWQLQLLPSQGSLQLFEPRSSRSSDRCSRESQISTMPPQAARSHCQHLNVAIHSISYHLVHMSLSNATKCHDVSPVLRCLGRDLGWPFASWLLWRQLVEADVWEREREGESEDQSVGWAFEGENIRRLLKKKPLKKPVHDYHTLDASWCKVWICIVESGWRPLVFDSGIHCQKFKVWEPQKCPGWQPIF